MTSAASPEAYAGRTVVDQQGNKIGSVGQVYINDQTAQPDWITVNTGMFGMRESFAPLAGATFTGDNLVVPFDKDVVKDAPDVADSDHMDADEQQRLYAYYSQYVSLGDSVRAEPVAVGLHRSDKCRGRRHRFCRRATPEGPRADDTSGPTTDDAMTRSEEQLRVGTERVEAGRARLRKYVVTEQQTVQVPVTREEVRVEREPITDANRGDATVRPGHLRGGARGRAARGASGGGNRGGPGGARPARHRDGDRGGDRHRGGPQGARSRSMIRARAAQPRARSAESGR